MVRLDDPSLVPARCNRCGKQARVWARPYYVKRGQAAQWMNAPMICECGGQYRGED